MPTSAGSVGNIHDKLKMKKQSFYVWFLGAQESRGLRDEHYVRPVLKYLLDREKDVEPTKVTLQVSSKGLKIVQNIARTSSKSSKTDQMKHLIPPHSVTYVMQAESPHEDIVCCILLIYNPVTKCPVHIHAYRCDSVETACSLRIQLKQLMDQIQKLAPSESVAQKPVESESLSPTYSQHGARAPRVVSSAAHGISQKLIGSDGRSTRTDEEDPDFEGDGDDIEKSTYDEYGAVPSACAVPNICRSAESLAMCPSVDMRDVQENSQYVRKTPEEVAVIPHDSHVVRLYDSLAQELKEKFAGSDAAKNKIQKPPLLLPPKDYDTVCRKQGNLMGIDFRRSTNHNIVGRPGSSDAVGQPVESKSAEPWPSRKENLFSDSQRKSGCAVSRANVLASSSSGKSSSGIGSDEMLVDSPISNIVNTEAIVESSDDEWNYRPANRYDMDPDANLRPRHKSMDFLQQRLDHFHMGDPTPRRTTSPERHRGRPNFALLDPRDQLEQLKSMTYFGQQQPLRPLGNQHSAAISPSTRQTGSKCGSSSLHLVSESNNESQAPANRVTNRLHERPISFPMGVAPVKRDIPLTQLPHRFGFHQHPVKESMIESVVNYNRPLSPRTRAPVEQSLPLISMKKPAVGKASPEPKSAYFPQRLRSSVDMQRYSPENRLLQSERPDLRRQSLAEFKDGPSMTNGRNPLAKYFANPLERRAYGNRYSVAESNGHRLY